MLNLLIQPVAFLSGLVQCELQRLDGGGVGADRLLIEAWIERILLFIMRALKIIVAIVVGLLGVFALSTMDRILDVLDVFWV